MNAEWTKRSGTAAQPNKPARAAIKVGLATPGALAEIEMIAVKNRLNARLETVVLIALAHN